IMTLNILEDYLQTFPGCLVVVSHDRYFMDKLVDHLFVIGLDAEIKDFPGNYSEWRESIDDNIIPKTSSAPEVISEPKPQKNIEVSYNDQKELNRLEREIAKLENNKKQIMEKFIEFATDSNKIIELNKELSLIENKLEEKEIIWLELASKT